MIYKFILLVVLCGMIWLMMKTIMSAHVISASGSDQILRSQAITTHAFYGRWLLGVTFGFIVMIELKKLISGGILRDWLFFVHLPFAILFFVTLLATVVFFNGLRFTHHSWLGYLCFGFFIPTVLTGIPMILRMAP